VAARNTKLAALTRRYEFSDELFQKGQFTFHIQELHRTYGMYVVSVTINSTIHARHTAHFPIEPTIGITPEEIHVQDADFFEELYVRSGKLDKYVPFSNHFGTDQSLFTTASHDHHRLRRGAINPFFSKKKIVDFQPVIQGHLDKSEAKLPNTLTQNVSFRFTELLLL
jgi:hypothetical protein